MDTPAAAEDDFATRWIGQELDGRYRVVELLAAGGMGAVFVADHLTLPKQVAIKMIRDDFASESTAEERFKQEALATARIDHPHVVSAIDYGHLPGGGTYLVIQLVRGESLWQRMVQGPLPWAQVCQIGAQVADALAAAHAAGIVHRDLKPENILLEPRADGSTHARVVDFGLARVSTATAGTGAEPRKLTRIGSVLGTPGYMSPEQLVGEAVDERADLYALGVILWEACAGCLLWNSDSLVELRRLQMSAPAKDLRDVVPEVPAELAGLVERLLARKAADRPGSAAAARDELRALVKRAEDGPPAAGSMTLRPAIAAASAAYASLRAAHAAEASVPAPAPELPAPAATGAAKRGPGLLPLVALLVLGVLALVGIYAAL